MLPDFQMPVAKDEHDRKLLSDVQKYGWHVVSVFADETGPGYSFSVGLYLKFGHPEILVMGLSESVGAQFINDAAAQISNGKIFQSRERNKDLAVGFTCSFVPILVEHYKEYLGYGVWFYRSLKRPFPAIQLVWPDKKGVLPWEENYDEKFYKLQRLLDAA